MAIIKCKMCGGDLEINEGLTVAECEYCGTKQTIPTAKDEVLSNLFNRANNLRIKCEFDKAEQIYEKILQQNDKEAEAHWGIILCKYGIEYVEDPKTLKRVPTCHRTSYDAVTADADYLAALQNADVVSKAVYEAEAKAIDEIQKNILNIVKNEKPFDVFICYKETDPSGKRTIDSTIANDIYHQLTQEGLKVFYAAITLEDKLGQEYEPYIFAALNSAKAMLVIGTKPEYFSAVWVKNEWSRYLKLMKTDRSKLLIPCYKDMDAYDLPEEFAHLQAQDMGKIGFINDVVRGIKKVVIKDEPKAETVVKQTIVTESNTNVAPLLKRAFMFLEDGDWKSSTEYCEKVLDLDPENASAYLGKLMAELRVKKQESLKDCDAPFDGRNNYQKAIRFADDGLKATLTGYIEHINTRNENARLAGIYNKAKNAMSAAKSENGYKEAARMFETISKYKDAAALAKQCYEKAEIARKDNILADGKVKMGGGISNFETAIKIFESIAGWRDADKLIDVCKKKIKELEAKAEADRLEREKQEELARIEAKRQEELARVEAKKRAKRNKKIAIIVTAVICVVIAFVIVLNTVIIPNGKYNDAIKLMNKGKYTAAITAFEALEGYKDSDEMINECKYTQAVDLMNQGIYPLAIKAFEALDGYKDSATKIEECNAVILEDKYNEAIALMNAGNIVDAYEALVALDGYKDSADKANSIYDKYNKVKSLKDAKVGDYVFFGAYEQDNDASNGKENIEWLVLEAKNGRVLVISKYTLDHKQYNTSDTDVTWETCTLRKWLNNDFFNSAFTADEKAMIPTVTVSADKNPNYSTNPGNATQDQVFLLSINEANKYFRTDSARQCEPTDYALEVNMGEEEPWWWLRSPGREQKYAAYVFGDGVVCESGLASIDGSVYYFQYQDVRPAMWIDLE